MAKNMLEAVIDAEQQCAKREANAKTAAAQKAEKAKQDAAELLSKAKEKALANAEALYAQAKADGEGELQKAVRNANRQCNELSQTAEKNRSRVIDLAIKQLVD